jgi:ribosome-associated protein
MKATMRHTKLSPKVSTKVSAKVSTKASSKAAQASRTLAKRIAEIGSDHKAHDIAVLDLRKLETFTDFFIVMSGTSDRQVMAIADAIHGELKLEGHLPLGEEGRRSAHWALIDYGDVVVHVFYAPTREHYALEKLWFDAPRVAFKGINA